MKKNIENFIESITEKNTITDIDNTIDSNGDWKKIKNLDVILKHIITSLTVQRGTYLFDPSFGSGLYRYIFEPQDQKTLDSINRIISNIVADYRRYTSIDYDVQFLRDKKGFRINLLIEYEGKTKTSSIDVDENILKEVR